VDRRSLDVTLDVKKWVMWSSLHPETGKPPVHAAILAC
jgi:hypothetical protein